MSPPPPPSVQARDWPSRQREWQRRLPRLRLDAEPVEEQVERYRRATVALSVVTAVIGAIVLALFAAFGAPLVGLVLSVSLAGAVISSAWRSQRRLARLADEYVRERHEANTGEPSGPSTLTTGHERLTTSHERREVAHGPNDRDRSEQSPGSERS